MARAGSDIAMIACTSGSTGQPKGVMHVFERACVECATLVAGNTQVFFAESRDT